MRFSLCSTLPFAGLYLLQACQTLAARERLDIAIRQGLLNECEHIWFNDSATLVRDMWSCRPSKGVARYLTQDEQEVLMLRDYRVVKDDTVVAQQSAHKPEGQMAPEEIEWVIRKNTLKLSICDKHLGKTKKLETPPQVKVYLNIRRSGAVDKAQVLESSVQRGAYQKCLVSEMRQWSFPKLRSGLKNLEVRYPIVVGR